MTTLIHKLKNLYYNGNNVQLSEQDIGAIHSLSILIGQMEMLEYVRSNKIFDYEKKSESLRRELLSELKEHGVLRLFEDPELEKFRLDIENSCGMSFECPATNYSTCSKSNESK